MRNSELWKLTFVLGVALLIAACGSKPPIIPTTPTEASTPQQSLNAMTQALQAKDVDLAATYVGQASRGYFFKYFASLEVHNALDNYTSDLKALRLTNQSANKARFEATWTIGGEDYNVAYLFALDNDGVWKLYDTESERVS